VPEEINHLFKRGVFGQGMNVKALVTQDSTIPVNETDVRLGGNNSFESRLCDCHLTPLGTYRFHRHAIELRSRREISFYRISREAWRTGAPRAAIP
jgi:hypothetical protein